MPDDRLVGWTPVAGAVVLAVVFAVVLRAAMTDTGITFTDWMIWGRQWGGVWVGQAGMRPRMEWIVGT